MPLYVSSVAEPGGPRSLGLLSGRPALSGAARDGWAPLCCSVGPSGCPCGPPSSGPSTRALRPGPSLNQLLGLPGPTATCMVTGVVSCLNGCLPLAERAAVRSGPGSNLAPDYLLCRGRVRRRQKCRKTCALLVWMRSVDDWPLVKILKQMSGGKPRPVAVEAMSRCDRPEASSFRGPYAAVSGVVSVEARRPSVWDGPVLEELSGGKRMASGRSPSHGGRAYVSGRALGDP